MAHIPQVDPRAMTLEQQRAEEEELRLRGRMTNMKRTLLHSPMALRVYGEWFTLRDELLPAIGDRSIFIFAHAISRGNASPTGIAFMRRALIQMGFDPDALDLTPEEADLVRFGEALGRDPHSVGDELWAPLASRYSDKTLVDLVAFAGIMVATNVFMLVVDTPLDAELGAFLAR
ncbi:MAG TPA: hypothetical protein VHB74_16755 [Devosia sp.]|jgi:alkylhydroperoxidase family enzyme|nr:hypothetical protein [Devosia sp.]